MKMELIFIPSPATGHLMATVEMVERLLDEDNRLSITVIIISFNSKTASTIASLTAASNTSLRYEVISGEENPTELTATDSHVQILKPLVKDAVAKLLEWTRPDSPRLAGFVVDMYCTCMIDVADEFGVPSYLFYTSNAGFLVLLLHMQFMYDSAEENNKYDIETKGILVNTIAELEPHALKFLSNGDSDTPPVYSVGPVLHLKNDTDVTQAEILEWLDEQPAGSVVFLCFGSMGGFSEEQAREIATALEGSGHRFLWSLRRASPNVMKELPREFSNLEEILPQGFIDRMKARGKVIGWAPQAAVLEKPAVGGFISHGGWNSTLESLWFGVPTAIWPLYAEQKFNAFEMVEELGLSVEIRKYWRGDLLLGRTEMELVTAEEIERGIRVLMEQGSDVRKRVKEISQKCHVALMDGGSSRIALRKFLQDVSDNIA
ncbi:unnamed protein product [Brassica rapa]|uniref:Glycosyltransferase n=2 Tax=Brassica TaxID=3705 RepID=A0A816TQ73_BRANA|nr:unnamed protein product [Brassica napus]CAG7876763.1 unnamed protein product [Brassica rapa]